MKEFSCAFWNVLSSWKIWSPKKLYILIKIIKPLLIDVLITNVDDFPGFIPWPAFFGGAQEATFYDFSPVRHRVAVRKGDQGATGCSQEPPVVSSCIVARCNLCLVDGFSLCFCLVNETCCVFGLPRTIVTYFSWYFCSKISPEIQVITAAGEANYTLITKTAKVDLPWQVTLESETDRNDGPIHHLNYCCTPFMT